MCEAALIQQRPVAIDDNNRKLEVMHWRLKSSWASQTLRTQADGDFGA